MVEYFFHKATIMAEDNLIDEEMKTMRAPRDEKIKKAHGIFIQTTCLDETNY